MYSRREPWRRPVEIPHLPPLAHTEVPPERPAREDTGTDTPAPTGTAATDTRRRATVDAC